MATTALVLSGGGTAGGAWMLGLIAGLRKEGRNLGDADLIVGTSAGARVGAALAAGSFAAVVEMYRRGKVPPVKLSATLEQCLGAATRSIAELGDGPEAARRTANLEPLGPSLASEAERREMVAAHVPGAAWPQQRLLITAVDADSGERVAFDRGSGVDLVDALSASGALPGLFRLTEIDGRRYADGGLHSPYNADLAAGSDEVIVLSPLPLNPYLQEKLDSELAGLDEATVRVVIADHASLAAIGPNPLSAEAAQAALQAGMKQAPQEVEALAQI